jgi:galactokinase
MPANADPVDVLRSRLRAELSAAFVPARATRFSRSPGRLDVMGGVAESTGAMLCTCPIDRFAAIASQGREDPELQIFSFNQFDAHLPFTLRIPLAAIARNSMETLRNELADPGRHWAAGIIGCTQQLHAAGLIDLLDPAVNGLNLAVFSDIPPGAGLADAAAVEVAALLNLTEHFGIRDQCNLNQLAAFAQAAEQRIVGNERAGFDAMACLTGQAGSLSRLNPQTRAVESELALPEGVALFGIDTGVPQAQGDDRLRDASVMGHQMILATMREMGRAAGRVLTTDPLGGFLANLDPDDYKKFFRPSLPEAIKGGEFVLRYGDCLPAEIDIVADRDYPIRSAMDHQVLEAMRVRNFIRFIEKAAPLSPGDRARYSLLNKAGHLMYASHFSYSNDAALGCAEGDLLVGFIRQRAHAGFYGARITDQGRGGTVAVLAEDGDRAREALTEIAEQYHMKTGRSASLIEPAGQGACR